MAVVSGSTNLTNTNTACECLLDAPRCFCCSRDLLLVVRSLHGGADAMRKEGQRWGTHPQNRVRVEAAVVLRKPCANLIEPYSVAVLGLLSGRRPKALNGREVEG
jgi:hypothetical protein